MKLNALIAVVGFTFLAAGAANAQTFTLGISGMAGGNYQTVGISLDGNAESVLAGGIDSQVNGSGSFTSYCVDLGHTSYFGSSWGVDIYDTTSGLLSNGSLAGQLYNTFNAGANTADKAAALQIAIWGAVYNGAVGASGAHFNLTSASTGVLDELNTIASTDLSGANASTQFFLAQDHGAGGNLNQNLIGGSPVPEPASMLAIGVGLAGLARKRRKPTK